MNFNNKVKENFSIFSLGLIFPLIFSASLSLITFNVNAQISGNVRASTSAGQESGNTGQGTYLTNKTQQLNVTGSCDSTCDAMGPNSAPPGIISSLVTQLAACGAGYTGSKTQSRNQNPDGTFTVWADVDTSQCVCNPTYQDSTQTCASPLGGTFVQRTPWVCNNNVGSLGAPTTLTNNCFTPCVVPATQYTSDASCPIGQVGNRYYQKLGACPGGAGSNSIPTYGGWTMYSNTCALPRFTANQFSSVGSYSGGESDATITVTNNTGYNIYLTHIAQYYSYMPPQNWGPGESLLLYAWILPSLVFENGQTLSWNGIFFPAMLNN